MKTAGVFIRTKIPEISVGSQMNRSIFEKPVHLPYFSLLIYCSREFEKRMKKFSESASSWMPRSDRKMLIYFPRVFPLVSYRWVNSPHVINTILNIMPLFKFFSGNLPGLAASGLRLGFAGSQNNPQPPLPPSLKYNVRNRCLNVLLNQLYIFQRRIACNVQSIFTPKMNWKPRSKKRLNSNLTELHNF